MKLADLEVFVVGNPPPGWGGRYFFFVKVSTACGVVGYGEVYAAAVGPAAMEAVVRDVFERHMAGENPENTELMFRRAYSSGFTQRPDPTVMGAFSGLEMACWDILGKAHGRPVHAFLGGMMNERLRSYTYLYPLPGHDLTAFWTSPEMAAECAAEMVRLGFTAVKFDPAGPYTLRGGHQPAMGDIALSAEFCRAVRGAVGHRADILFGTHGQFTTSGAIRLGRRLEEFDPLWFEEPVPPDNPDEFAKVAAALRIPVATGERLSTKAEFAAVLKTGGASIVQPALGRSGGVARNQEDRGDRRSLQRPGRAASLRRAGRVGGEHPAGGLHPQPADGRDHPDRRRLSPPADRRHDRLGRRLHPDADRAGPRHRLRRGACAGASLHGNASCTWKCRKSPATTAAPMPSPAVRRP